MWYIRRAAADLTSFFGLTEKTWPGPRAGVKPVRQKGMEHEWTFPMGEAGSPEMLQWAMAKQVLRRVKGCREERQEPAKDSGFCFSNEKKEMEVLSTK